jgi:hypothetical protein
LARLQDVCLSPDSSDIADIPEPPLGAQQQTFVILEAGLEAEAVEILGSIRPPGTSNLPVSKRIANLPGVGNRAPKIANGPSRRNEVWDRRVVRSHKLFDLELPAAAALTLAAG